MRLCPGFIREIRFSNTGQATAWINCPAEAIPSPGKFVSAWSTTDYAAPLSVPLFAAEIAQDGFLAVPPIPSPWEPGATLELRGPFGCGFSIPSTTRHLALAAFGETPAHLLPVIPLALQENCAVALFSDSSVQDIPSAVEIYPLQDISEALSWADLFLISLPVKLVESLRGHLHLKPEEYLPCSAQVLVLTDMPCYGIAECGACAVPGRRKWKLACQDGPVFDINELAW